ncbi:hypothetical protein HY971_01300 [Candidatus Kaiserbacteria bacterium]|nr:hypothetical protein [Candidatus Kaiserbacteria bacterium]
MQSKKSSGVIDLRGGRAPKSPPRGQVPLFSLQGPRAPEPPKRPMPLRARRRRVRAVFALAVLVLCGAIFYGVSWASYLPQFNVSGISVVGAKGMKEEHVKRFVETVLDDGAYHVLSRRNIFLYPQVELEKAIASFHPVKSVHISRPSVFATDIVITIEEREPFARWCTGIQQGYCYLMDASGFIYAPMGWAGTATSSTQYVFAGGLPAQEVTATSTYPLGESFVQAHLPGMLSLLKLLGQAGLTPLGAHVDNDQDFFVQLGEGFTIKASYGADANTLVKNLQLVLSSDVLKDKRDKLEYIDLRFTNRAYYKLFSGGESAFGGNGQAQQNAQ